tara:strand:+ start:672 stop:887 length:216 start_codon:yes stop_codon:yes gene_type:complete
MIFSIIFPIITNNFKKLSSKKNFTKINTTIQKSNIENLIHELDIDYELGLIDKSEYKKTKTNYMKLIKEQS